MVASGHEKGGVKLWDCLDGQCFKTYTVSADQCILAIVFNEEVLVWGADGGGVYVATLRTDDDS